MITEPKGTSKKGLKPIMTFEDRMSMIGLDPEGVGELLTCTSCDREAVALNEYKECVDCFRAAMDDALPTWKAEQIPFQVRYRA